VSEIRFTRFTSSTGPLAKIIGKAADGSLSKAASAQFYAGSFETLCVETSTGQGAQQLVNALSTFGAHQALSPSLSLGASYGEITTQKALAAHPGAVARTTKNFGYLAGVGGLAVLDFDPQIGVTPLTPDELIDRFFMLCPGAAHNPVLHWVSGSSLIYDGDRQLSGVTGQRMYVAVKNQADIPRFIGVLNNRAWLLGVGGHIHVSAAGSLLVRGLFDSAMADAGGRMDFAPAGAVCHDGLIQLRQAPVVVADGPPLDTQHALPDLTAAEESEVAALIGAAKLRAESTAQAARAVWLASRQQSAAIQAVTHGTDPDAARDRIKREHEAMLGGVLTGAAELIYVDDKGIEHSVPVDQVLGDPRTWHGRAFLSPHEPGHRGRSPDAIAYLMQATPILFDLNDRVTYRLQRQPVRLQVAQGGRAALADQIASELAAYPDLMQCAGQLVRVVDGTFAPVSRPMLSFIAGTRVSLYRRLKDGKESAADCDRECIDIIHALLTERCRKVIARSSIPLIDASGRLIDRPGLDEATGIYLEVQDDEPIPMSPSKAEVVEALRRLWKPWSLYHWTTPHCCAAVLATVLTVPLRPTIDGAPGLFADSFSQAQGKSSLTAAVMVLAQGDRANMKSWAGDSEVEIEKYLLSLARAGAPVISWDNVIRTFDSAIIATALIEGRVSGRQLGVTNALSPVFRAMWLASGINASIGRDCATRFLQARIACPENQPQKMSFPFEPSEAARADRLGIVRAILTVHRAWHEAGCPQADGITTRFPAWGRTIRHMTFWLSSSGLAAEAGIGPVGDCADAILNRVNDSDPDTDGAIALLSSLQAVFEGSPFAASEAAKVSRSGKDSSHGEYRDLWDAVTTYFPKDINGPSPQRLSALFRNRRDKVYAGLKLVVLPKPATREGERMGQLFAVVET
jgi:hypothetical protein